MWKPWTWDMYEGSGDGGVVSGPGTDLVTQRNSCRSSEIDV